MAEDNIDKVLPNEVRQQIKLPPEEEIQEKIVENQEVEGTEKKPIEMVENEDGSVDIDFEPKTAAPKEGDEHYANLAEFLPDDVLQKTGSMLVQKFSDYTMSRKEWEKTYTQGLDLLGFKYDMRSEPFQGASGATHPVLAEAVTQFQSLAYEELLPADGPVRTQVMGIPSPEKYQQSQRIKEFMNWQLMDQMK